jgi:hypothetical protein
MSTPDTNGTGKVSLEALLRLKRAERPTAEFWPRFEQELRAKQLAAIVAKRPWWVALRLPQVNRALARWQVQLPLGAAAALVVSVVMLADRPAADAPLAFVPAPRAPVGSAGLAMTRAEAAVVVRADAGLSAAAAPGATTTGSRGRESALQTASAAPPAADEPALQPVVPTAVAALTGGPQPAEAWGGLPPVDFVDLASGEAAVDFEGGGALDWVGLTARVAEGAATSGWGGGVPASGRDGRRERIRARLVLAANLGEGERVPPGQLRDGLASGLADDRGYDGSGRIGVGGDRLTLKF